MGRWDHLKKDEKVDFAELLALLIFFFIAAVVSEGFLLMLSGN